jgi:hypothetical protein
MINPIRKGVEDEIHDYSCHKQTEEGDYTVALQKQEDFYVIFELD